MPVCLSLAATIFEHDFEHGNRCARVRASALFCNSNSGLAYLSVQE